MFAFARDGNGTGSGAGSSPAPATAVVVVDAPKFRSRAAGLLRVIILGRVLAKVIVAGVIFIGPLSFFLAKLVIVIVVL